MEDAAVLKLEIEHLKQMLALQKVIIEECHERICELIMEKYRRQVSVGGIVNGAT